MPAHHDANFPGPDQHLDECAELLPPCAWFIGTMYWLGDLRYFHACASPRIIHIMRFCICLHLDPNLQVRRIPPGILSYVRQVMNTHPVDKETSSESECKCVQDGSWQVAGLELNLLSCDPGHCISRCWHHLLAFPCYVFMNNEASSGIILVKMGCLRPYPRLNASESAS